MKVEYPDGLFSEEELINTPKRHQKFINEWINPEEFKFTTFPKPEGVDQMIIIKDIPFYSMCSHHLIPFFGKCHVGYIPNERICGLSKIPRVIDLLANKPQIQEKLTQEVADFLSNELKPLGLMVVIEAEHLCMSMRGIQKPGHRTITNAIKGIFTTQSAREEFLCMIKQ